VKWQTKKLEIFFSIKIYSTFIDSKKKYTEVFIHLHRAVCQLSSFWSLFHWCCGQLVQVNISRSLNCVWFWIDGLVMYPNTCRKTSITCNQTGQKSTASLKKSYKSSKLGNGVCVENPFSQITCSHIIHSKTNVLWKNSATFKSLSKLNGCSDINANHWSHFLATTFDFISQLSSSRFCLKATPFFSQLGCFWEDYASFCSL